jgi:hypothetical protein
VVALDVEEMYEEIEMEEETQEVKAQARDAFRRGQEMASLAPVNPWDRDNKIQERDSHNAAVLEVRRGAGGWPVDAKGIVMQALSLARLLGSDLSCSWVSCSWAGRGDR